MHLQVRELPGGEFEEKVGREALAVAPHLPVQACGGDAVERGELGIERHPMTAQDEANTRRREGQATRRLEGAHLYRAQAWRRHGDWA